MSRELPDSRIHREASIGEGRRLRRARSCDARAAAAHPPIDPEPATGSSSGDLQATIPEDLLDEAERAVLVALANGRSGADIAASLQVPEEELGIHMAHVLSKLHRQQELHRRTALRSGRPGRLRRTGIE